MRDDFSTDGNLVGSTPDVGGVWAAQTDGAGSGPVVVSQGTITVSSALAEDVYSNFTAVVSTGSVYTGMDINYATPSSLTGTYVGAPFTHFNAFTGSGTTFTCLVRPTGHTSTSYKLQLGQSTTAELTYGTTYRLVYSFNTTSDKCSLWVNPTSEASTRIMTANAVAGDPTISAVAFRQTNSTPPWTLSIRNLIVATNFAEACPPPAQLPPPPPPPPPPYPPGTAAVSTVAGLTSALANTAVGRIVLASGTYYLSAELSITRSVVLEAVAGATVTLNAQASSSSPRRVLYIAPGSSGVVQLIGLNITGGYVGGGRGGGVYIDSGTVAITSSSIYGNMASEWGGGVFVRGGTVTLSSCTITGNTASHGGGVHIEPGTVTLSSCTIAGNSVAHYGGGVEIGSGTLTLSSCTITGNSAGAGGGGVAVLGGTVAISSSTISGNNANSVRAHAQTFPWP